MTPAEIKKTRLYRTLAPCVIRKDREELARMLAMVPEFVYANRVWGGMEDERLRSAFPWARTPQGPYYWVQLSQSLDSAGHECW